MQRLIRFIFQVVGFWGMVYVIIWSECFVLMLVNQAFLVDIVHGNKPMWTIGMIGGATFLTILIQ